MDIIQVYKEIHNDRTLAVAKASQKKLWAEINKIMGRCARTSIQLLQMKSENLLDTRDIDKAINTFFINWIKHMAADIE